MKTISWKSGSRAAARLGVAAGLLSALLLSACGGGAGGYQQPAGTDVADVTPDATGHGFTVTSFKTGLSTASPTKFMVVDNATGNAVPAGVATYKLDTANHGTQGTNSAAVTVIAQPSGANNYVQVVLEGDGGVTNWSSYHYLTFDVATGADQFDGLAVLQSAADWSGWCQGPATTVAANSKGQVTLDLTTCGASTKTDFAVVKKLVLGVKSPSGTFYVDNIRVSGTPPVAPPDLADGTPDATGGGITLTSFKTGLAGFGVVDNKAGQPVSAALATVSLDTTSKGTEGSNSAAVVVNAQPATPAGNYLELALDGNGGVTNWTSHRYLSFDVNTGATQFDGAVILQSKTDWSGWCQGTATTVAANSRATVTLDLSTCGTNADFANVKRLALAINSPTGTFYVDNIRVYGTPPVPAADLADGTNTAGVYTLTSFKNGLGSWKGMDDQGGQAAAASSATGTVTLDTVVANATDGSNSAAVTVSTNPIKNVAGDHAGYGLALDGNGALADWTGYRYVKADIVTGASAFNGTIVLQTNGWATYCNSTWTWINANTAKTTLVLDLSTCTGANLAAVSRLAIYSDQLGTFNVDSIRLDGYTAPPAGDTADAASSVSATEGNVVTLTSFKTGLGSWKGMDDQGGQAAAASSATGTVTLDTVAANATDGPNSAAVTVSTNPIKNAAGNHAAYGLALDSNGPVADWTGYRYIKADIVTGAAAFNGTIVLQTNGWATYCNSTWTWINANTAKTTLVLDLNTCTGANLAAVNRFAIYSDQLGTFNVDNIRLTTK